MIAMIFDDGCDVGWFGKGLLFVWNPIPLDSCLRRSAPGIPLRSRFARPRPPYAKAKGDWGVHPHPRIGVRGRL